MNAKSTMKAVLVAMLLVSSSHAAQVTWTSQAYVNTGYRKNTMGVDQFDQSGSLHLAVNCGGAAQTLTQSVDPDIGFTASDANLTLGGMYLSFGFFHANSGGNNDILP